MQEVEKMKMERAWAMPNKWTFQIKPIAKLLKEEMQGEWIDPFAGQHSPAQVRNDINPAMNAEFKLDALDFLRNTETGRFDGALFDPPYSLTQLKQCYQSIGKDISAYEAQHFPYDIKTELGRVVKDGGKVICCGWDSNGLGMKRGFTLDRILLVAHGRAHNDTIVTVERKQGNKSQSDGV